jgi:hypothetical protein
MAKALSLVDLAMHDIPWRRIASAMPKKSFMGLALGKHRHVRASHQAIPFTMANAFSFVDLATHDMPWRRIASAMPKKMVNWLGAWKAPPRTSEQSSDSFHHGKSTFIC